MSSSRGRLRLAGVTAAQEAAHDVGGGTVPALQWWWRPRSQETVAAAGGISLFWRKSEITASKSDWLEVSALRSQP